MGEPGDDVLGSLTALGPFFAVDAHSPGQPPAVPWRPGRELADPSGPLRDRLASVQAALTERMSSAARVGPASPGGRRSLAGHTSAGNLTSPRDRSVGAVEPRVAASALHLGLAARLAAPALGAAVLGRPLGLRLDDLWWQDVLGRPVPLSVPAPLLVPESAGEPGEWDRLLLDEVLAPVTVATARLTPLSDRLLWGNVASALNAAAAQLARQRPDLAEGAWRAAARLFANPWLRQERHPPGPAFRRSTCCLLYRLAPGHAFTPAAVCGDCVLAR